jgi:ribonuclease P protein component
MPKSNRLSRADIVSLKPLRREHGRFFTVTIGAPRPSAEGGPASGGKFACVVSKKVALRANKRNLIKRRLRSALRAAHLSVDSDMIFTAKRAAAEATYPDIVADVGVLVNRLR